MKTSKKKINLPAAQQRNATEFLSTMQRYRENGEVIMNLLPEGIYEKAIDKVIPGAESKVKSVVKNRDFKHILAGAVLEALLTGPSKKRSR